MNTNQDKLTFESTGDGRELAVCSHQNDNNSLLFFIHDAGTPTAIEKIGPWNLPPFILE